MRIVQLSDIHIWRYVANPIHLANKRLVGMASLLAGRAGKFRLERMDDVVRRVEELAPDHLLITGDLTTTALESEFREATRVLEPLLSDPSRVTIIPGNHDRYTGESVRKQRFEAIFGSFAPPEPYPWIRPIDDSTAILGLDATRSHLTAKGKLPVTQLHRLKELIAANRFPRLIIASHYPLAAPEGYASELAKKRMINAPDVMEACAAIGPHIYCCGHVHAAWAFEPVEIPGQLCLNSGAPLLRDRHGHRPPGFLEIYLEGSSVRVLHHAWVGHRWQVRELYRSESFFEISKSA